MNFHVPGFPLQLFACLLTADFFTGLFHWLEDTYTTYEWPEPFQRWIVVDNISHHRTPARFTRSTWRYRNQIPVSVCGALALLLAATGVRAWQTYAVLGITAFSNEIHAWAHRRDVPFPVAALQRVGFLQSRRHHGAHHSSPYAARFCTTTNFLNPVLDALHFWRALEASLSLLFGLTPKRLTASRGGF